MIVVGLDHVNIRTRNLDAMIAWYGGVLGMKAGWRPDFPFGGAWLYAGDRAVVHLVEADRTAPPDGGLQLEHAAFAAEGYAGFVESLDQGGHRYELVRLEQAGIVQVNVWDPDGNHLHIDFAASEAG